MFDANAMCSLTSTYNSNITEARFWAEVLQTSDLTVVTDLWFTEVEPNPAYYADAFTSISQHHIHITGTEDSTLYLCEYGREAHRLVIQAADRNAAKAHAFVERARQAFPEVENNNRDVVPITFWSLSAEGHPSAHVRNIESHHWEKIRENYPMDVRARLDELMQLKNPEYSGKLVLWHGPPGTGKTHCIRALADAWRDWCNTDYVVDPEELFARAHYMMSALVAGDDVKKWRLIVIEDSGQFLRADAMNQAGAGFGRLLNLTDGLVGQGLKLIILITTNEPFDALHPAVARPGRCVAKIGFDAFPAVEASHWLGSKVFEDKTLADLYEAKAETQISKDREAFRSGVYI